jgi:hypothetical protein
VEFVLGISIHFLLSWSCRGKFTHEQLKYMLGDGLNVIQRSSYSYSFKTHEAILSQTSHFFFKSLF